MSLDLQEQLVERQLPLIPLDTKILGGVALRNYLSFGLLQSFKERIDVSFEEMSLDDSAQFGVCLAYGFNLSDESLDTVDSMLKNQTRIRNCGTIEAVNHDDGGFLWLAKHKKLPFSIVKHIGPVFLSDHSHQEGVVYSLSSKKSI